MGPSALTHSSEIEIFAVPPKNPFSDWRELVWAKQAMHLTITISRWIILESRILGTARKGVNAPPG